MPRGVWAAPTVWLGSCCVNDLRIVFPGHLHEDHFLATNMIPSGADLGALRKDALPTLECDFGMYGSAV